MRATLSQSLLKIKAASLTVYDRGMGVLSIRPQEERLYIMLPLRVERGWCGRGCGERGGVGARC